MTHIVTHNGEPHVVTGCKAKHEAAARYMKMAGIDRVTPCTIGSDSDASYYSITQPGHCIKVYDAPKDDPMREVRRDLAERIRRTVPEHRRRELWRTFVRAKLFPALRHADQVERRRACLDSQMPGVKEVVRRVAREEATA